MIVFITGASSGFGAEMARTFVGHGHQVVISGRRQDRLDALAAELGDLALPLAMDVTDQASIDEALALMPQSWRQVDVLVNNAGLALLPAMVERGSGLVINIGSVAGRTPYPGGNVYGATKAFVDQFTLNLRADLVGTGVRATNIAPGLCGGTEFSNVRYKGDDAAASKVYEGTVPLSAQDIAATAFWIATLPPHVNINHIEMMPTCQGYGPLAIKRG